MATIPALRGYAFSLTRNRADADDLVQQTLLKALSRIEQFEPGTNLRAWLFRIMRNSFYTNIRSSRLERMRHERVDPDDLATSPTQEWSLRGKELMAAVARLPVQFRETLILVVVLGESYEDCAVITNCRVGTVKSRVNRARRIIMAELQDKAV